MADVNHSEQMGKLSALRIVRAAWTGSRHAEYPKLEALVEAEFSKVSDGYHLARWIVPLVGLVVGTAVFLPLTLLAHPLFGIGLAGLPLLGLALGTIFHIFAKRITPVQLGLRKKCAALGQRMVGWENLTGVAPALSPQVGAFLNEAAGIYLSVKPEDDRNPVRPINGVWTEASHRAKTAMAEAMTQMLILAEPASIQEQELELARGWAQPLLEEMRATAEKLVNPSPRAQIAAEIEASASPMSNLAEARTQLERLEKATQELDSDHIEDKA
jgi:hypothetical protein